MANPNLSALAKQFLPGHRKQNASTLPSEVVRKVDLFSGSEILISVIELESRLEPADAGFSGFIQ
jgi:hypothetical protein